MNSRTYDLDRLLQGISNIPPAYHYKNETNINPAYATPDNACITETNEMRIWAFRSDRILALGIKNSGEGYTKLQDKFDPNQIKQVNLLDRFGHPSLAVPEGKFDGSVYYAGWLALRENHIDLIIYTGRFENQTLTASQKILLEAYISQLLIDSLGKPFIRIYDSNEDHDFAAFVANQYIACPNKRIYTQQKIDTILDPYLISHNKKNNPDEFKQFKMSR